MLLRACKFLQHNEVNQTLVYFNLLEEKDIPPDEGTRAAVVAPSVAMVSIGSLVPRLISTGLFRSQYEKPASSKI